MVRSGRVNIRPPLKLEKYQIPQDILQLKKMRDHRNTVCISSRVDSKSGAEETRKMVLCKFPRRFIYSIK